MSSRAEREREFHDERFGAPDERHGQVGRFYKLATSISDDYRDAIFRGCEGANILEYGCGTGGHAIALAQRGASVTAIDISPVAIARADSQAQKHKVDDRVNFVEMNAESLTFDPESFDLVCGKAILHHLDLAPAVAGLARVLRPSGRAVFLEPLGHNPAINGFRRRTPSIRSDDEQPLRRADLRLIRRHFGSAEINRYYLLTLAASFPRLERARGVFEAVDRGLVRIPWIRDHAWQALLTLSAPHPH